MFIRLSLFQKILKINSNRFKLDADPKTIQQINFSGNLDISEGSTMFFIIEEANETVLGFSKGTV